MRFWRRNCVVGWRHRVDVVTCAGRNIAPAQAHDLTREQRAIADTVGRRTARFLRDIVPGRSQVVDSKRRDSERAGSRERLARCSNAALIATLALAARSSRVKSCLL